MKFFQIPVAQRFASLGVALSFAGVLALGLTLAPSGDAMPVLGDRSKQAIGNLPDSVERAVRRNLARFLGVSRRQISVVTFNPETYPDGCLGLPAPPDQLCHQAIVQGWQVTVTNGQQNWVYRSDRNGRTVRMETQGNNVATLPNPVFDAVIADVQKRSELPVSSIQVVWARPREWSDGCLGLARSDERCEQSIVPGWQVGTQVGQQFWIYRTNNSGSVLRLEGAREGEVRLPPAVSQMVLRDAQQRATQRGAVVRVVQAEQRQWSDGCLGLPQPGDFCTDAVVDGWRLMVESNQGDRWIYHTDGVGRDFRIEG